MNNETAFLTGMFKRNHKLEIRCLGGKTYTGVFDNIDDVRNAADFAGNYGLDVYFTLNPFDKEIDNNVKPYRKGVRDKDISQIKIIPFDFDPVRDTGEPATDEEVQDANERCEDCIEELAKHGWSDPVIGFSGNGYHLLYLVDLPNDDKTKQMMDNLYRGLNLRFTDDLVKFDTTVRNPSRIFRLYGTLNQKAGRRSGVYSKNASATDKGVIFTYSDHVAPPKPAIVMKHGVKSKGYKQFSIADVFKQHGLYKRPAYDSLSFVCCPWVSEHSSPDSQQKTDTIIYDDKWPTFFCHHDACRDRNVLDVISFFGIK